MAVWAVCLSLLVTLLCASAWRSITYYPEQVGKPTNTNYDSPYAACNVSGIVRGYSGNQISYLVAEGATANAWLPQPLPINLSRGTGYDTCGEWLNAVVWDEEAGIVRGYYHQEWNCHYSDNSFTNKSVAYAESHDGGRTFIKPGYPNNTIILPPRGNTTRQHQTGQGDHTVVVKGDYMYLYFLDWDGYQHTRVSVARATRASGGVPGSWWKWYKGNFSQPGLHGNDDMLYNMSSASSIRCRRRQDDFIALQPNGKVGLQVIQSADGLHWQKLPVTVVPTDFANWTRGPDSGELYAYVSPVGNAGMHDVDETFWLYYTYLQPGDTFMDRYPARRQITLLKESGPSLIELVTLHSHNDTWTTTAMIPNHLNYTRGGTLAWLLTQNVTETSPTHVLHDCVDPSTHAHWVGLASECPQGTRSYLRRLGYVHASRYGNASLPLYRCCVSSTTPAAACTLETTTCSTTNALNLGFAFASISA